MAAAASPEKDLAAVAEEPPIPGGGPSSPSYGAEELVGMLEQLYEGDDHRDLDKIFPGLDGSLLLSAIDVAWIEKKHYVFKFFGPDGSKLLFRHFKNRTANKSAVMVPTCCSVCFVLCVCV